MAEPRDTRLIYEILKDVQARLARLDGMREGFASLPSLTIWTQSSDQAVDVLGQALAAWPAHPARVSRLAHT